MLGGELAGKDTRFAPVQVAYPSLALGALLLLVGCGHEVILLDPVENEGARSGEPIGITVSVFPGSFERTRLQEKGVLDRFARQLREGRVFQGVLYPVPEGVRTRWEIELVASDGGEEPDSNFWKAAFAAALPPLAWLVTLESAYALRLEALLLQNRVLVGSYVGEAHIRHRYGPYANRGAADREGVEVAVRTASAAVLRELRRDRTRIEDLARSIGRVEGYCAYR